MVGASPRSPWGDGGMGGPVVGSRCGLHLRHVWVGTGRSKCDIWRLRISTKAKIEYEADHLEGYNAIELEKRGNNIMVI